MPLAPIVLFVYNRPHFTRQTLEALALNNLAAESTLFIYADGPKENADQQAKEKVVEVRKLIREKKWCKTVTIIEAEKNKGLAASVIDGVTEIVNRYGKIIVLEDDVVTSPYFLTFMNEVLIKYEFTEKVLSAGSWNYYFPCSYSDVFFTHLPDTIAWATWKRAWDLFESNAEKLLNELTERKLLDEFNLYGNFAYEEMLKQQIQNKVSSWAIRWTAIAVLNKTLTIYPARSLSKHIGFGSDSTHVKSADYNDDLVLASSPIIISDIPLIKNTEAINHWIDFEKNIMPVKTSWKKRILFTIKAKLKNILRRVKPSKYGWFGNYKTWSEAEAKCAGYNTASILEKIKTSIKKIKSGEAAYERDSVLFKEVQYSYPLLYTLHSIAKENNQSLRIVDFGGSLGSSYFQNKILYSNLKELKWSVVEQSNFADAGAELIADNHLSFFHTIENAEKTRGHHDILLLSCVLPYLEQPYKFLKQVLTFNFKYIIIDNTYFNNQSGNRLTIQTVNPEIYTASYPAWFLDYQQVISIFSDQYTISGEYLNEHYLFLDGKKIQYRGIIFKLR